MSLALAAAASLAAEVHTMTLAEAVRRAVEQNPDVVMARIDEQKAAHQVTLARDPFIPKVFAGSGMAYTHGIPLSVGGSVPSIVQAQAFASIVDRPASFRLAQARESANSAGLDADAKRDEVALRTVELYLRAERLARETQLARAQTEGLERVAAAVRLRVEEGRELPVEVKRAELDLARVRQRASAYGLDLEGVETALASVLGLPAGDRVGAAGEERPRPSLPDTEDAAAQAALEDNAGIRKIESALAVKGWDVKAARAERLPKLNLIGQYALLGRFNNYEDFYRTFQRHNGQIGVSFEVPLYTGRAAGARAAQAELDVQRLRSELESARTRVAGDARGGFRDVRKAEAAAEVARLDLDLAREDVGVLLARMEEGRASLRDVEAARYLENEKWIAFHAARQQLELARYSLLRQTGALLAQFR
ncbi:MAG: TolC family protein [Bryobacteraceae bacterium]|nr:TolC family protein [Bryobacteraceae bacterium]